MGNSGLYPIGLGEGGEMAEYTSYFNGEWVPDREVKIDPMDRGFRGGQVVFDVERTFNGKSFRMKEHMDRLYRSLKYMRIDPGLSLQEMLEVSEETIHRNEHLRASGGDFNITQFVTPGHSQGTGDHPSPTVCVQVSPINFARYADGYDSGRHGVIARTRSYSTESLDPKIKHWNRINFSLARMEASDVDEDAWALLLDLDGNLSEGTGYNFFLVTGGLLRTPGDRSILQGISRAAVFDLARQLEITVLEEDLQPYDLYTADEAFFCSTSYCIMPMTRADNRVIGDGKPGPVTRQLLSAWSEMVGVDIVDQAQSYKTD
jgi:branched-chain amino acid aminotransferase